MHVILTVSSTDFILVCDTVPKRVIPQQGGLRPFLFIQLNKTSLDSIFLIIHHEKNLHLTTKILETSRVD